MNEEEKRLLNNFEARLRQLIYLNDESKREIERLKGILNENDEYIKNVRAELERIENEYTNLKTAKTISLNGGDVRETKLLMSKLVREVDKCIALLNELS